MTGYGGRCVSKQGAIPRRVSGSSTARVSRQPRPATSAGSTGKKVAGRKRPVLVDGLGNLLAVLVHSAGWSDAEGGAWLLFERTLPLTRLRLIWADQASRGDLVDDARELLDLELARVERPPEVRGFTLLPRRRVVERSVGWFNPAGASAPESALSLVKLLSYPRRLAPQGLSRGHSDANRRCSHSRLHRQLALSTGASRCAAGRVRVATGRRTD